MRELNGVTECEVSGTVCPAQRGHSVVDGTVVCEVAAGSLPSFVSVAERTPFHYPVFYTPSKGKRPYSCFAKILIEFQGYNNLCNLSSTPPSLSVPNQTLTATASLLASILMD